MRTLLPFALLIAAQGHGWCAAITSQLTVYDPQGGIFQQLTVYEDGSFTGGDCAGPCSYLDFQNTYYIPDTIGNPNLYPLATQIFHSVDIGAGTGDVSAMVRLGYTQGVVLDFNVKGPLDTNANVQYYPPLVDFYYLESSGPYYDVTNFLLPTLQSDGYTATFYYVPFSTPEPGTLVFLAIGLAAIARRQSRSLGRPGRARVGRGWRPVLR